MAKKTIMVKSLIFHLKKRWFDMIKADEKGEEYREITPYWCSRLLAPWCLKKLRERNSIDPQEIFSAYISGDLIFVKAEKAIFLSGYPKLCDNGRMVVKKNPHIKVGKGSEELGATKDKIYFVIYW